MYSCRKKLTNWKKKEERIPSRENSYNHLVKNSVHTTTMPRVITDVHNQCILCLQLQRKVEEKTNGRPLAPWQVTHSCLAIITENIQDLYMFWGSKCGSGRKIMEIVSQWDENKAISCIYVYTVISLKIQTKLISS